MIFRPDEDLDYSTIYNVKVNGRDLYNNSLGDYNWNFITQSEPKEDSSDSNQFVWRAVFAAIIVGLVTILVILYYKKKFIKNK